MIIPNLEMRRGDLKPDLVLDILDQGVPVDFTTATAIKVLGWKNGVLFINGTGTSPEPGVVKRLWTAPDTAVPGTITFEVEAMWPGGKPQTFRAKNKVVIYPDLG
jgi:hypothetical protein